MQIVLNEMPDHPLACIGLIFSILIGIVNQLRQVGSGPVSKRILNDLPGGFQSSFLPDYHKKRSKPTLITQRASRTHFRARAHVAETA
jgi:hypothetical protein